MLEIAFIDHYDSFSFSLIDWLENGPCPVAVLYYRADDPLLSQRLPQCSGLVMSPGPGHPEAQHATRALLAAQLGRVPILGVCLGHQLLGLSAGLRIVRAESPLHGSRRLIRRTSKTGFLQGMPMEFSATAYNSLTVAPGPVADGWRVTSISPGTGELQSLEYVKPGRAPALGLQYHPESFLSDNQRPILSAWLNALL